MLDKIDIVMWSYRPDASILEDCLISIEMAIPPDKICHKTVVIPASNLDDSYWPFLDYGWKIEFSPRASIPMQANIALSKVHTDYFASFEQDIIINPEWFERQSKVIESSDKIAVAQGVRFFKGSKILEAIDTTKRVHRLTPSWSYSFDNTLFRTKTIRELGGFPTECPVACDGLLREKVVSSGYEWRTDRDCASDHIHKSFKKYYQTMIRRVGCQKIYFEQYVGERNIPLLLLSAPKAGLNAFKASHVPEAIFYPILMRYAKIVTTAVAMASGRKLIWGKLPLDVRRGGSSG